MSEREEVEEEAVDVAVMAEEDMVSVEEEVVDMVEEVEEDMVVVAEVALVVEEVEVVHPDSGKRIALTIESIFPSLCLL